MKTANFAAAALAAVFLAAFLNAGCAEKEKGVPDALRLHIIANSDDPADQAAKLKVRDAVLEAFEGGFGADSRKEAEEKLLSMGGKIQEAAENALRECGMDYGAELIEGEFDFPDREYGGKLYPAGRYRALRVILGEGNGRNWWCVMFPPLCLIETEPGGTEVNEDGTLKFKSFFAKLWREIFG
ncbi:MAG: stage II sporulation protein R [Clostridiales bacterium]|nr:stage II sporulation protein R [Clostridiales bacterium]